jgi:hypothetical protein
VSPWVLESIKIAAQITALALIMWFKVEQLVDNQKDIELRVRELSVEVNRLVVQAASNSAYLESGNATLRRHMDKKCHDPACEDIATLREAIKRLATSKGQ